VTRTSAAPLPLRVSYGFASKAAGVVLLSALTASAPLLNTLGTRLLLGIAFLVAIVGTLEAFTRELLLTEERFIVRNLLGKRTTYSYEEITSVELDPHSVLAIHLQSGSVIRFPAKLAHIDGARKILEGKSTA